GPYADPGTKRGAMRGSETLVRKTGRRSELAQIDVLLYLIENRPGRSALELAQAIYGEGATELGVEQDLVRLVSSGEIERHGTGALPIHTLTMWSPCGGRSRRSGAGSRSSAFRGSANPRRPRLLRWPDQPQAARTRRFCRRCCGSSFG